MKIYNQVYKRHPQKLTYENPTFLLLHLHSLSLSFSPSSATGWGLRVSGVLVPPVVVSGSTVELVCNYHHSSDRPDPLYSIKWYRDVNQFYEYIPRRNPPVRVYELPHIHVDVSEFIYSV